MKRLFSFFLPHIFFIILLGIVLFGSFWQVFLKGQVPFSANLLASFFNPYAAEKFVGWEQGIPNKPTGIDDLRIFYPQRHFTMETFLSGQIPFWNPYNQSGNFQAGLSETAVFYPLFFIFLFLSQSFAWIILILIEPILVGIGMYLYLSCFFKDKKIAAFGAVVFAFSGIVIVRAVEGLSVGHTLLWFPFVLFGIEGFLQKRRLRFLLITLVSLCFSIFAGWFQFTFYIFGFSLIYTVFRLISEKTEKIHLILLLPFVFTPLITLFHIVPAIETLLVSPRGTQSIAQVLHLHLMPLAHIFTFIFPDIWGNPGVYTFFGKSEYKESILYIGTIPFIISLFSVSKLKNKIVTFFAISGLVSLVLGLDTNFTKSILSIHLPIISTFLPNRIFLITSLSFTVLAAFGLESLKQGVSKKIILFTSAVVLCMLVCVNGYIIVSGGFPFLFKYQFFQTIQNSLLFLRNIQLTVEPSQLTTLSKIVILPDLFIAIFAVIFLIFILTKKYNIFFLTVVLLTIVGQIYFAQRYIPFSNLQFMYPKNPVFSFLQKNMEQNRFISTQDGYISSNIPLFYELYSPDGVGSMYIGRYGELVKYMQTKGQSFTDIPRIETRIDPSQDDVFITENPYLLRFMQIDGIAYVVTLNKHKNFSSKNFSLVWENSTWQVYKYNEALPRFFLTSSYLVEKDNRKELRKIFDVTNSSKTILLEEKPGINNVKDSTGIVTLISYTPNTIQFKTSSQRESLLFLSDTYAKNFVAYADGKPTKLLRADYAFRAVVVPKGNHTVVLQYKDTKEILAFGVALLAVFMLWIGFVYLSKHKGFRL